MNTDELWINLAKDFRDIEKKYLTGKPVDRVNLAGLKLLAQMEDCRPEDVLMAARNAIFAGTVKHLKK